MAKLKEYKMKHKFLNAALVSLVMAACLLINVANAGIIKTFKFNPSEWDHNNSLSLSYGDSLTIKFDDSTNFNSVFWSNIEYFQFNVAAGITYKIDSEIKTLGTAADLFSETNGIVSMLFNGSGPQSYIYGYDSIHRTFAEIKTSTIWAGYRPYGTTNYMAIMGLNAGSSLTIKASEVPEPSTLAIFALGMFGLISRRIKS